ncbi:MAG: hypothetical protein ACRDYD_08870, partial [Acidimicrobiales bacterium]
MRPAPHAAVRLELDSGTRRVGERLLIGGSPLRALRLSEAGARVLGKLLAGPMSPTGPMSPAGPGGRLARRLVRAGMASMRPGPRPGAAGCVEVVVPTADRPGGLRRTLARLGDVGGVVVVDDASADPASTAEAVAAARA